MTRWGVWSFLRACGNELAWSNRVGELFDALSSSARSRVPVGSPAIPKPRRRLVTMLG
jgi:hypothetical protein